MTTPAEPDLITWLRAQLDEDEQIGADDPGGMCDGGVHLDRERWLAEVDAKRRILDLAATVTDPHDDEQLWYQQAISDVAVLLALPYADRPGFREEWRPA